MDVGSLALDVGRLALDGAAWGLSMTGVLALVHGATPCSRDMFNCRLGGPWVGWRYRVLGREGR